MRKIKNKLKNVFFSKYFDVKNLVLNFYNFVVNVKDQLLSLIEMCFFTKGVSFFDSVIFFAIIFLVSGGFVARFLFYCFCFFLDCFKLIVRLLAYLYFIVVILILGLMMHWLLSHAVIDWVDIRYPERIRAAKVPGFVGLFWALVALVGMFFTEIFDSCPPDEEADALFWIRMQNLDLAKKAKELEQKKEQEELQRVEKYYMDLLLCMVCWYHYRYNIVYLPDGRVQLFGRKVKLLFPDGRFIIRESEWKDIL